MAMPDAQARPVLRIQDLAVAIRTSRGTASILDGCSLSIGAGEVVGLVGESGCGKSTVVKTILGVLPASAEVTGGSVEFEGEDLLKLDERTLSRRIRGRRIGFIPQDPALALNPNFTVGEQLLEIWRWHAPNGRRDRKAGQLRAIELLRRVQIPDPAAMLKRYPHQFSGGQRQRLLIAAALLCEPRLVIADEATTALDVTTQQQILVLLSELRRDFGISVLFVTHDFGVVSQLCDKVTVMYAGQTVEQGPKAQLLGAPRHPYTVALMDCHPDRMRELSGIPGVVPSPLEPPSGCRFQPRCPRGVAACAGRRPHLVGDVHQVSCIHFDPAPPTATAP
jgi:oligopeptide/dipeptide ABC transporter ATP-binding protein